MHQMRRAGSGVDSVGVFGTATLVLLLLGCSDHPSTAPTSDSLSSSPISDALRRSVVVSGPTAPPTALSTSAASSTSAAATAAAASVELVVYVSLPPGAVPGSDTAIIRNLATGHSLAVPMANGGFDPVPLAASAGDTLTVEARARSILIAVVSKVAPHHRAPTVVRTDPPLGKTDVPLNMRIDVIFSEPVDSKSVTGSVRLSRGGVVVAGSVSLGPSGLVADFVPNAPLAPQTNYELAVTTGVLSQGGVALDATVNVPFTTGVSASPKASVELQPWSSWVVLGDTLRLTPTVRDTAGNVAAGSAVTWTSLTPAVASVSSTGLVTAIGLGHVYVSASSAGALGAAGLYVQAPGPAQAASGRIAFVSDRTGTPQLYLVNVDGSGLTQLTHDTLSYSRPAWAPDATRIAVVRNGQGIVVMQVDGTGATLVAPGGVSPAWSLDGNRIRYVLNGGSEIDEVTLDGSQTTKLCAGVFGGQLYRGDHLDWSPDRKIAVFEMETYPGTGEDPMVTAFTNDDHCTRLQGLNNVGFAPAWSPDGQRIAGVSFGPGYVEGGTTYIVNGIWSSDGTIVFRGEPGYISASWPNRLSWSPDGMYLAFVRNYPIGTPQVRREIWVTPANGTGVPLRIGATGVSGWDPAWAPR